MHPSQPPDYCSLRCVEDSQTGNQRLSRLYAAAATARASSSISLIPSLMMRNPVLGMTEVQPTVAAKAKPFYESAASALSRKMEIQEFMKTTSAIAANLSRGSQSSLLGISKYLTQHVPDLSIAAGSQHAPDLAEAMFLPLQTQKQSKIMLHNCEVPSNTAVEFANFIENNHQRHLRVMERTVGKHHSTLSTENSVEKRCKSPSKHGATTELFPYKLHRMLEHAERDGLLDVVSFFPHGKSFCVHKPSRFVSEIMPKFFKGTRITSFQRQLNLYGFRRISYGPEQGGYYHKHFLKRRCDLCHLIKRIPIKGTATSIVNRESIKNESDIAAEAKMGSLLIHGQNPTSAATAPNMIGTQPKGLSLRMQYCLLPSSSPSVVYASDVLNSSREKSYIL